MIFKSPHDIEELIANNYRRLQKLREQKALFGFSADPTIDIEIEEIEKNIKKLNLEMELFGNSDTNESLKVNLYNVVENCGSVLSARIYLSGDFSLVSVHRQSKAINAFAAALDIPPKSIEVYRVHEFRVGDEEISRTPEISTEEPKKAEYWRIPVTTDIAAGVKVEKQNRLLREDGILDYILLKESEYGDGNHFGLIVTDDGLTGDNILPGDIVLIHQQPTVEDGEIAAAVITTPEQKFFRVLRRLYVVFEKRKTLAHWLLESSNPSMKNLVVIPSGADVETIEELYSGQIRTERVEIYKDAELAIAGKFVGVLRKTNQSIRLYRK